MKRHLEAIASAGVVDARRRAAPWTGIGKYVDALYNGLPSEMGTATPRFWSGNSFRVRRQPHFEDLAGRGSKVVWEQVTLPHAARHAPFLHLPYYEGPFVAVTPLIVTIPDLDTMLCPERYSRQYRLYYNRLLKRLTSQASHIVTISETSANDIRQHLAPRAPISVTYLGVDDEFHAADPVRGREVAERVGLKPQVPLVVTGAGVAPRKNISALVAAIAEVRARGGEVQLAVTGALRSTAPSEDPPWMVRTGVLAKPDLAALYAFADLSVAPSLYEGFGFAVVESMAAGCPVVASDAGSHPEIAGPAARLFPPRDVGELARHIEGLLSDGAERAVLAVAGRARAERFRWSTTVRKTAMIYDTYR